MLIRTGMLTLVAMLVSGCSSQSSSDVAPGKTADPKRVPAQRELDSDGYSNLTNVTLYLAGMNRALKIL